MNYDPKVLPSMQKWRGSTDPITKRSRAKVRTAPGMVLDTVKPTFQSIVQNPPFKTKHSDSTSRPWGGASWTVEKQRASCKSLSLKHGVTLSGTSLFNIAGAALVTSLPARALTWTLSRHRLNQPSIRRLEGTTSKNNELNAYGRKESFLWRHAAAATSLVFPPESTRRRTNQPTWFPSTKTRATHLKETNNFQPASCQQASTF